MTDKPPSWKPAEADTIVRFLDGLAEDLWLQHGDAITAYREAKRERERARTEHARHERRQLDRRSVHDQTSD